MYIDKIRIQNYKGIQHLEVPFSSGVNLVVGDNGCGKTSLILAIRSLLLAFLQENHLSAAGKDEIPIPEDFVFTTTESAGDLISQVSRHFPSVLDAALNIAPYQYTVKYSLSNPQKSDGTYSEQWTNNSSADALSPQNTPFQNILNSAEQIYPLICAFEANRTMDDVHMDHIGVNLRKYTRREGYFNCLSQNRNFREIENWCLFMELGQFQKQKKASEYSKFKAALLQFFNFFDERLQIKDTYFSAEYGAMVLVRQDKIVPVYYLSDGYKYIYGLIMELLYRATILNPQPEIPYSEMSGVVVVDEIDVHLHPNWQWKIVDALTQTFPKVQFILATHSPIVISSAKNAKIIRMISPDEIYIDDDRYGEKTEDVLFFVQGSSDQPAVVKEITSKLLDLIEDGQIQDAEQYVHQCVEQFGENSSEARIARDFYASNKWIGEGIDDLD